MPNSSRAAPEGAFTARSIPLTISESARRMLLNIRGENEIDANIPLRVFVTGMACSGPQFGLGFDERAREGDLRFDLDGIQMVVDPYSIELLSGASIDYVEVDDRSGFRIHNPHLPTGCGARSSAAENAGGSCAGCG
jgi:iron-sulfur cluster assembly accessory protein